jgi:hypothetical protein
MTGRPARRHDGGETLVELLLTISVLSITVVSVIGALLIAVGSSTLDRRAIQAQSLLKSWGEFVVGQTTDSGAGAYVPCATATTYGTGVWQYTSPPLQGLPAGFTPTVQGVEYWNGTTSSFATTGCTAANDTGVQRVELRMTVANALYPGFTAKYFVVVRKPCLAC